MDTIKQLNQLNQLNQQNQNNICDLSLPQDKEILLSAFAVLKDGLNKANKSKQINIQTATALRDTMRNLNDILANIIKAYYKDDKLLNIPIAKITIPDKIRLESMLTMIYHTIDKAQLNGAYETIDESGTIFDSLSIIGNLIGSMIKYINTKEQEKQEKMSKLKSEELIQPLQTLQQTLQQTNSD